MASESTCTITGTVCNLDGSPNCEVTIRATVLSTEDDKGGQLASDIGVTSDGVEAFTEDDGSFSITLLQGAKVLLEIPQIHLRLSGLS